MRSCQLNPRALNEVSFETSDESKRLTFSSPSRSHHPCSILLPHDPGSQIRVRRTDDHQPVVSSRFSERTRAFPEIRREVLSKSFPDSRHERRKDKKQNELSSSSENLEEGGRGGREGTGTNSRFDISRARFDFCRRPVMLTGWLRLSRSS